MRRRLHFGIGLPGVQQIPSRVRPWERAIDGPQLLEAARAAEAAGFEWVACSDHPAIPRSRVPAMGAVWFDAGSTLAFVAGATRLIRLLSHVLVVPYRHPLVVAKQFGTLDRLSGGRLILGVGAGHLKPEFVSLGAEYARRGARTDEFLRALAVAWEEEVATFAGETVAFRDVQVAPRPVQRPRPPFWVGGNSRAALRRAALLGEGFIPWQLTPEALASLVATARDYRQAAGRTGDFEVIAPLAVAEDAASDAVLGEVERWVDAGASGFQVGFEASSFAQYLDRLAWFGRVVAAQLG